MACPAQSRAPRPNGRKPGAAARRPRRPAQGIARPLSEANEKQAKCHPREGDSTRLWARRASPRVQPGSLGHPTGHGHACSACELVLPSRHHDGASPVRAEDSPASILASTKGLEGGGHQRGSPGTAACTARGRWTRVGLRQAHERHTHLRIHAFLFLSACWAGLEALGASAVRLEPFSASRGAPGPRPAHQFAVYIWETCEFTIYESPRRKGRVLTDRSMETALPLTTPSQVLESFTHDSESRLRTNPWSSDEGPPQLQ